MFFQKDYFAKGHIRSSFNVGRFPWEKQKDTEFRMVSIPVVMNDEISSSGHQSKLKFQ